MYYEDLSRRSKSNTSKTNDYLNRLLNAIGVMADQKAAREEQQVLNIVKGFSTNASQYNSEEQFSIALDALDNARDNVYGEVSNTLLDGYENLLTSEFNNFKADTAIKESLYTTNQLLNNLTQENHSENINEILNTLNGIGMDFRNDASVNLLKELDKVEDNVNDAIYLTEMFNLKDEKPGEAGWQLKGVNERLHLANEYMKAGNFKKARTLTDAAQIADSDYARKMKWENGGDAYRRHLDDNNKLVYQIGKHYITDDTADFGMFKFMKRLPTFGVQNLNTLNLKEHTDIWKNMMTDIFNDKEIQWKTSGSAEVSKLYNNYQSGGIQGFTKEFKAQVLKANPDAKNVNNLTPYMMKKYLGDLAETTQLFVPERTGIAPLYTYDDEADQNRMGAELFYEYYTTYLTLLNLGTDQPSFLR